MSRILRAVADSARLRLLRLCADRPTSVSELAAATSDSEPNVSRHLKQLAQAGLLRRVRRGQRVEYQPATESGFSADLLGLLLSRLAADDAPLREARARLHAIEAGARASLRGSAADWVVTSRLGRSLRGALGGEFTRDIAGARVLVRSQHREVLEALLQDDQRDAVSGGAPRVTLRATSKPEKNVLQSWLEAEGFQAEVLTSGEVRSGGIFDVCLEAPLHDELREIDQLPALLQRARTRLGDAGVLWCVIPYDLLEEQGSPPLRLRALLAECGIDCLSIAPVEAEGRHVLVARGRVRHARSSADVAALQPAMARG
ncbi:MAG: ArsR/SmtB family transcription factor [Gammaproteobacteria bacterium]